MPFNRISGADKKYKYKFRCSKGHEWESTANNVLNGTWCRICRVNGAVDKAPKKHDLAWLQQIAQERGGICLSPQYINYSSKYTFQCAEGHTWETALSNILNRGTWCPRCARIRKQSK